MNQLINLNVCNITEVLTMSSRQIAEYTNKNHADVCRDIRHMLSSLYGGSEVDYIRKANLLYLTNQGVSCKQYDLSNHNSWEYHLDYEHTECLITGYDAARRMKVIKEWNFLKQSNTKQLPDFNNPAESARAWADQYEQRAALEYKVQQDQPKVAFHDAIEHSVNKVDFKTFAGMLISKTTGKAYGRNTLMKDLRELRILTSANQPYQQFAKYFDIVTSTNNSRVVSTTYIKAEGISYITKRLIKEDLVVTQ